MKKFVRVALAVACLAVAAISFVSCGGKASSKSKTLYLYNWTYYTPDSVIAKFEEEFDCTVHVDTFDSNEVMYAKLAAGASGYDIAFPSQDYTSIMIKQGMVQEIDLAKFANAQYINPAVLEKTTYDPTMKYSVPYYMGAAGVSVNKEKLQDYERSWNIFADNRIAGHASMMDDMREVFGDALVSLGYSVNSVNDSELKEAADLISTSWKPNLVKFDAEGFGKSFSAGDFWVCQGYAEVIFGEVPEAKWDTVDFFIPPEGGPMYIDSMVILKGAKNYDLAMEFINFIHRPEIYAEFLDIFRFPSYVNTEAAQYMTAKPMYEAEAMNACELKLDLAENIDKYNNLWQEIRFTGN